MKSNTYQFQTQTADSQLEKYALTAVKSKRQRLINVHHLTNMDEQIKFAKLVELLSHPNMPNKQDVN